MRAITVDPTAITQEKVGQKNNGMSFQAPLSAALSAAWLFR